MKVSVTAFIGVLGLLLSACTPTPTVTTFDECVAAGNPIIVSRPRTCVDHGETFMDTASSSGASSSAMTEAVVSEPAANARVTSPLTVKGIAPGSWYFEGSLPVMLLDDQGNVIATAPGVVEGGWMTANPVPFSTQLTFQTKARRGFLVISKDNPSGLSENDQNVRIPVQF